MPAPGVAAGVLASRWLHPTDVDYAMVAGASLLGHSAGLGVARLWFAPEEDDRGQQIGPADRREPILRLGGALLGMGGGMLAARATDLRPLDLVAGGIGTGYGAVLGALAPEPSPATTGTAIARRWAAATWARRSAAWRRRPRPT